MPNARNLAEISLVINSVHNSVGPKNDFANILVPMLANSTARLWKFLQAVCLGDQFIS